MSRMSWSSLTTVGEHTLAAAVVMVVLISSGAQLPPTRATLAAKTQPVAAKAVAAAPVVAPTPKPVSVAASTSQPAAPTNIGIFISTAPSDPTYPAALDAVAALGCNVVYSYNAYDGTPAQVQAFLAYAQSKGLQVIVGLNDFYDQLPNGATTQATYSQYGATNQAIALAIVREFQQSPAVWGFSITDEAPAEPADLLAWQGTLATRYSQIKQLTTKPVMAVLEGWPDGNLQPRLNFFAAAHSYSDTLALDYYPIPYNPLDRIGTIMSEARPSDWFVEQVFSWSSYPSVVQGWGNDPTQARYPTTAEMVAMGRDALAAGSHNLLLYSYFDTQSSAAQLAAIRQAVQELKTQP